MTGVQTCALPISPARPTGVPGAERGGRDRLSPRTRGALADLLGPGHPDAANARVTVAVTRVAQGDLTGALDDLLEAQAALDRFAREAVVRPLRVRARLLRGDTLRQLGRYEEAVDVLRSAQRMARHTELATEADNSLGVALRFLGDFAGAARAYARALASLPADDLASRDDPSAVPAELLATLAYVTRIAPSFSLRGGTREILRGMIARGLGLR